jgi:predicted HTH domain antitoxin
MTIHIPDNLADKANVTEREALIELACRLFDAERISKFEATSLTGLSRIEFEEQLVSRKLPRIRISDEEFMHDLRVADRFSRE